MSDRERHILDIELGTLDDKMDDSPQEQSFDGISSPVHEDGVMEAFNQIESETRIPPLTTVLIFS